jgi:hypothetical protein
VSQTRLNGFGDPAVKVRGDTGNIFGGNSMVVPKFEEHLLSHAFGLSPSLGVREGLLLVERSLSVFGQMGQRSVFFGFQRLFYKIPNFQR